MNKRIRSFVEIVAGSFSIKEPVYEFGALQVPGQEGIADLRSLFLSKEFVGCDMREGRGVDKILNLHNIDLPSESVGTLVCMETLEHVEYPRIALREIYRILVPNGIAVISSPMDFPIHEHPSDYWRFTPEAFKSLLKDFPSSFVGYAGNPDFPSTVVGIGFKGLSPDLTMFEVLYKHWSKQKSFKDIMKMIAPPVLVQMAKRMIFGTSRL